MRKITTLLMLGYLLFSLSGCFILESFFTEEDVEYRILFRDAFNDTQCAWSDYNCGSGNNMHMNRMEERLLELEEENADIDYWIECVSYTQGEELEPIDS